MVTLMLSIAPESRLRGMVFWMIGDLGGAPMRPIAGLCREQGKTAVTIGHGLNLAQQACSHALLPMGDGCWEAGPIGEVMTAPALSRYLGHPIEIVAHGARRIFVPVQPGA